MRTNSLNLLEHTDVLLVIGMLRRLVLRYPGVRYRLNVPQQFNFEGLNSFCAFGIVALDRDFDLLSQRVDVLVYVHSRFATSLAKAEETADLGVQVFLNVVRKRLWLFLGSRLMKMAFSCLTVDMLSSGRLVTHPSIKIGTS